MSEFKNFDAWLTTNPALEEKEEVEDMDQISLPIQGSTPEHPMAVES